MSIPPRKVTIHTEKPADFDPERRGLPLDMGPDSLSLEELIEDHDLDDDADEESAAEAEAAENEFLYGYALAHLPELFQTQNLLEEVSLSYGTLMAARILNETVAGQLDDNDLDNMIAALLMFGETDEETATRLYDDLSADAQEMTMALEDITNLESPGAISEQPTPARVMFFALRLSDVEFADELFRELDEPVPFDEMRETGQALATLSEKGDIPASLLARAAKNFNILAGQVDMPLRLDVTGGRVVLQQKPTQPFSPRPPKPGL